MSGESLTEAVKRVKFDVPDGLKTAALGLTGLGLIGFVAALFVDADAAWRAYLSNFIFWVGIAQAGVIWSAVLRITNAHWGRSLMRLWEGTGFFLPIAFVLYLVLVIGGYSSHLYEWVHHAIAHKEAWLNPHFTFARGAVWLAVLFGVSLLYLYHSLKLDVRALKGTPHAPDFFQRLFSDATGSDEEWEASRGKLVRLGPALAIVYALAMSMFSFDLIMSVEPYWFSTMFGGYIFMGNMLMSLAFIAIAAGLIRKRALLETYIGKNQFWDVGKLLFAFTMLWTYLMWSQYLPIWYANMAEETGFVIKRTTGGYGTWAFVILATCWVLPWFWLLPRTQKQKPLPLGIGAAIVLVGMWLERWTIVVPSQFPEAPVAAADAVFPGWIDIVTMALFAGLFLLSYRFFLKSSPILAVGDPIMGDIIEGRAHSHHH